MYFKAIDLCHRPHFRPQFRTVILRKFLPKKFANKLVGMLMQTRHISSRITE